MVQQLIFDWDNVLVGGGQELYLDLTAQALQSVGETPDPARLAAALNGFWDRPYREVLQELLPPHSPQLEPAVAAYHTLLLHPNSLARIALLPGVVATLELLQFHQRLAIATSCEPDFIQQALEQWGLTDVFSQIVTYQNLPDASRGKPHPDLVNLILEQGRITYNETMVIGDTAIDLAMAVTAGCIPVAIPSPHLSQMEAQRLGVHYIVLSVADLPTIITN